MKIKYENNILGVISFVMLSLFSLSVNSTVLNRSFDEGVSKWNDDSSSGSFVVRNGKGILETGAGNAVPFSAVAIQGDDGSFLFSTPIRIGTDVLRLSVDLSFERIGVDFGEDTSTSSFTDNLSITFLDELDPTYDWVFSPETAFVPTDKLATHVFDIAGIAGRSGALAFELNDENDGFDTRVVFDNVLFVSQVPLPATAWLFLTAIVGLTGTNGFRKKKR